MGDSVKAFQQEKLDLSFVRAPWTVSPGMLHYSADIY